MPFDLEKTRGICAAANATYPREIGAERALCEHARTALPAACDEIERLRALCEQASHEIERLSFGDEVEMTQRIIQCLQAAAEGRG